MSNDLDLVQRVLAHLKSEGLRCWLFGGWAEEVRGVRPPREHRDIDLLYPAQDFDGFESVLADPLTEITAKRFPHKRAFEIDGVLVEIFLVKSDQRGLHTSFWGCDRHDWPSDTLCSSTSFGWPVAGAAALASYRHEHQRLVTAHRERCSDQGGASSASSIVELRQPDIGS